MESVAARSLKSCNIRRLVFASHSDQLVSGLRRAVEGCRVEVMSLTDVGLPEPSGSTHDPLHNAIKKAAIVAAITKTPAIGFAPGFYIDPLVVRWRRTTSGLGRSHGPMKTRFLPPSCGRHITHWIEGDTAVLTIEERISEVSSA
jgi:hypothetical protein